MARKKDHTDNQGIIHFERKLIRIGDSYAITVPKRWVETHGHKAGDIFSGMANSILSVGKKVEVNENNG